MLKQFNSLKVFGLALILLLMTSAFPPCFALADKPVNFIFLLDVSGSMVSRTTMVTDASGNKVTLFESLRQAIKDIVADNRLIKKGSRVCFITFGTQVEEKKSWPSSIGGPDDRKKLISLIEDKDSLKADRIGDTYMGGALNLALGKAEEFCAQSDPCTTTFILMLTDGWDEPPKDAKYNVRDVAKLVVEGQNATQVKVGIDTWQIAVIGLKSLPKIKEGTTTAVEVANLLNGTFLDVTQEKGSSVSKKIYKGLSKILLNQRGEFNLVSAGDGQIVDFGEVDGNGVATTSFDLELRACDKEEITSITVADKADDSVGMRTVLEKAKKVCSPEESITMLSEVPADALIVNAEKESYLVEPVIDENGKRSPKVLKVTLKAKAGSKLPVGKYLGCLKIVSSAKVPAGIPFLLSAPARLTTVDNDINVHYKRKGFFSSSDIEDTITVKFAQAEGSQTGAVYKIKATVEPLTRVKRNGKPKKPHQELPANVFNNGKPVEIVFDTNESQSKELTFDFTIPAKTSHGIYQGVIKFDIEGPPEMAAPKEIPVKITVKASDWEQVAPIAIPMFLFLIFGIVVYVFYSLNSRRK